MFLYNMIMDYDNINIHCYSQFVILRVMEYEVKVKQK